MYLTLRSTRLGWDERPRCAWKQRHELVGPFFFFFYFLYFLFVFQSKEYPLKYKHTRLLRQTHKTKPINVGSDQQLYNKAAPR